ncbi:4-hydroxyphenylacetate 3-monooxygenase, oxygenase component [Paenibacillus sp. VCA1]|uniref:4-hydroxyphenylacetate 3-monooxygenase, oxygenase component n=1 Tax=Paenibacillus sp. VCA1 TaxID=3039148 RepID=UPI0028718EF3|nr:4-hydroxyphenylacetate 3-monooxygenase, oxygenase component [Paenibacillus sp. VCA1]MDR9853966.1 4-hydroxyphenylacetate 3-monooxygenase, oxygenase component [Paenibacillus sp. VCA1]
MPAKNGKQFIDRIDHANPRVWIRGEQLDGKLSDHPAFRGLMVTQAELYDMQYHPDYMERMTYSSPSSKDPVGLSFMQPKTKEDLQRRREMTMLWGEKHHGLLGRSPDYMNTGLMAFSAAAELLGEKRPEFADNMRKYYEYCRERDISLSHAFVQPHASRFDDLLEDGSIESCAAQIVEQNGDGIVVSGAFLLATQGVTTDEILVYPPALPFIPEENNPRTFAFAVPNNLPGIRWICRETLALGDSAYDYPLSSRFDEMDTLVIFDEVLVPWERVFILGDDRLSMRLFQESGFHVHCGHQVLCRYIAKTEFTLGILLYMAETLDRASSPSTIDKMTEVIAQYETLKSLLVAAEAGAAPDRFGSMLPDRRPIWTANVLFPKMYPRMIELIQLLGGSSVIMIPSELDFAGESKPALDRYLRGSGVDATSKTALFRLAWDLSSSGFGGRQTLYERFFFGDASVVASRLYQTFSLSEKEACIGKVKAFLQSKDE